VLKFLSPSLAAALLLASHFPVYAFDFTRFYTDDVRSEETETSKDHVRGLVSRDTFELAPSGRIDRISDTDESNTDGFDVSQDGFPTNTTTGNRSEVDQAAVLNTSYSVAHDVNGLPSECGPSPMSVAEIEDLVGRTAQSYGVDPGFAKAIAWTESRFDRNRNSQQGARGPMQLMPTTAAGLGVTDICDPVANIDGGVRHLKLMLEEFQNPILAAAAYNAGAQAVYDSGGVPPFGETVRYVAAVINHQMGLKMPRKAAALGNAAGTVTPSTNEMASDVIGARGSRFIKGVMQF